MTQYVRPMDLHSHNGGCELYGCIPVVPADEHNTALGKLDGLLGRIEGMRQLTRENLAKGYCDDSRAHAMMEVFDIIENGPPP